MSEHDHIVPQTFMEAFRRANPLLVLRDADPRFLSALDKKIAVVVVAPNRQILEEDNSPLYYFLLGQNRRFEVCECIPADNSIDVKGGGEK